MVPSFPEAFQVLPKLSSAKAEPPSRSPSQEVLSWAGPCAPAEAAYSLRLLARPQTASCVLETGTRRDGVAGAL